ncbi:DUF1275 domain-containing protein [Microbispora sp. RL4-1S]|uniref:DUF1275 domain-containing protein n=1 Tax=Microbispora oryzae TaxID=2806554 RepID=A0A940WES9_9ACTN|nr:DUF1275 family protein [Microbispora oryzae]MBP2704225.1 DUF1275 domain-containing protein [Microbispora oryzae]
MRPGDEGAEQGRMVMAVALAAAAGAMNAISFVGLGGVFTSVMTGNLVLLGLSVARLDPLLAAHAGGALAGFAVGVLATRRAMGAVTAGQPEWRGRTAMVLAGELALLTAMLAAWSFAGGRPSAAERFTLGALASVAMGLQSGAARSFGISGLSTTFFTGTLTGVLSTPNGGRRMRLHSVALLSALTVGAAGGGCLAVRVVPVAPALPAALVAAGLAALLVYPDRSEQKR